MHFVHTARAGAENLFFQLCGRQPAEIIQRARVAALQFHHLFELLEGRAGMQVFHQDGPGFTVIARLAREPQHPDAEQDRDFRQVGWALGLERLNGFDHFERVACRAAERLLHVRDQCRHAFAHAGAHAHHAFGQGAGLLTGLHERAFAGLHVKDQGIDAFG